jgi:hypothetical protein
MLDSYRPHVVPNSNGIKIITKDKHPDYFVWLINVFGSAHRITILELPLLLDDMERAIGSTVNKTGATILRISTWIAALLSELSITSELDRLIDWHQPLVLPVVPFEELEDIFVGRITLARQVAELG